MATPFRLLLLLFPLTVADFDCPASPRYVDFALNFYQQLFTTVGANFQCNVTFFFNPARTTHFALEAINMGPDDYIQVTSPMLPDYSSNGSDAWSIQQFYGGNNPNFTLYIRTGANSQMKGTYLIHSYGDPDIFYGISRSEVNVSYGAEGFVLQKMYANPSNFYAPAMFVVSVDTQVVLNAAAFAYSTFSQTSQLSNIWIYEGVYPASANVHAGVPPGLKFLGTAEQIGTRAARWITNSSSVTLYYINDVTDGDYMAVIANEKKNLENCAKYFTVFYPGGNGFVADLQAPTDGGGACVTVLNQCRYDGDCDGPVISWWQASNYKLDATFLVYAGVPHPSPVESGLLLLDLSPAKTYNALPQILVGNARTVYLSSGNETVRFDNNKDPYADIGRRGFMMTNFHPFLSSNMVGAGLYFNAASYAYNITLTVTECDFPSGEGTLSFKSGNFDNFKVVLDRNTNVNQSFTFKVPSGMVAQASITAMNSLSRGAIATFVISEAELTTTPVPTSSTSPASTSTSLTSTTTSTTSAPTTESSSSSTTPLSSSTANQLSSTTPRLQTTTTSGAVGRGTSLLVMAVGVLKFGA